MLACFLLLMAFGTLYPAQGDEEWVATPGKQCRTNRDCGDIQTTCCSITPAFGKRQVSQSGIPLTVNYCLGYKGLSAPWCSLNMQYSEHTENYFGLCPCGPGLTCRATDELDPKWYPRDRYGKCQSSK